MPGSNRGKELYIKKAIFYFGIISFSISCATTLKKSTDIQTKVIKFLSDSYPSERKLLISDLNQDSVESFKEETAGLDPGVVCGNHGLSSSGCAVLLVSKTKRPVSTQLIYAWDENGSIRTELIEDFRSDKAQRDNVFLVPYVKQEIENRGEGPDKVVMSSDGIQRIIEGQSAVVFYFENRNLKKTWTAD